MNVTVVYPCVDIDNITDSERNQILSETQKHLTDYFRTRTTTNVIAAVNIEQVSKAVRLCVRMVITQSGRKRKRQQLSI